MFNLQVCGVNKKNITNEKRKIIMLQKLRDALKTAMKNKDVISKTVIQGIISSADEARIKVKRDLTDQEVIDVIRKENKQYAEALDGATKAGRLDLVADAKLKIDVTESFLPAQMSKEDLTALAKVTIQDKGLDTSNKTIMMKELIPVLKAVADGKLASEIVNSLITK